MPAKPFALQSLPAQWFRMPLTAENVYWVALEEGITRTRLSDSESVTPPSDAPPISFGV